MACIAFATSKYLCGFTQQTNRKLIDFCNTILSFQCGYPDASAPHRNSSRAMPLTFIEQTLTIRAHSHREPAVHRHLAERASRGLKGGSSFACQPVCHKYRLSWKIFFFFNVAYRPARASGSPITIVIFML